LVDNPDAAREAASLFRREEVDFIFLYVATYALSSTVLPVVQHLGVPVVVLNLQPVAQLDYEKFNALGDRGLMTGIWLEHCQSCSAPEHRLRIQPRRHRIPYRHRPPSGRRSLAGNSRLGGRRPRMRRDAPKPSWCSWPLLWRNAGCLQRH
jgi:hypothetical protein